jgi:pSer/pThr/pTyr-binding forkhead associated (FHA) protein/tetratricopeptide (TPR) repeat protein
MVSNAILTVTKEGETIKTCPVDGEVVLGRAEECGIRLDDRAISRRHAIFRVTGDHVQVEKKSEFAPLSVNGIECTRAVLKQGDLVLVGPYQIRFSHAEHVAHADHAVPAPGQVSAQDLVASPTAGIAALSSELHSMSPPIQSGLEGEQGVQGSPDGQLDQQARAGDANQNEFGSPAGDSQDLQSPENLENPLAAEDPHESGLPSTVEQGSSSVVDEDAKTTLTPSAKVSVQLIFKPGTANFTTYDFIKEQIFIGRGKDCDIVLNDKKASRKNTVIQKSGINFVIEDLQSANGTYVNSQRVTRRELSGDDVIQVGGVVFDFKVVSAEYERLAKDFMVVPAESEEPMAEAISGSMDDQNQPAVVQEGSSEQPAQAAAPNGSLASAVTGSLAGGIPGLTGLGKGVDKKKTLLERFKALPKQRQILIGVIGLGFLYWLNQDDDSPISGKKANQQKKQPTAAATQAAPKGILTFEKLNAEQKEFIKAQYDLGFNYFKNHDYDRSIYELNKIFDTIPDYENAREIKRYALEGKQRLQAIEDERQKKAEEAKLKAKIAQLVEETGQVMLKKDYEQAKELFTQILAIDPDNAAIIPWRHEIEASEEQIRLQKQEKQVQEDINKRASILLEEATRLKKEKKYYSAIDAFHKVLDVGASDQTVVKQAKKMIEVCYSTIRKARDPVLTEAKKFEESGDFVHAFALYKKATHIDPKHPAGYAGMKRIKDILHDRAKVIYTEAVLAESYSDFENAKKMFEECKETAPSDDIYHERAERKLAHYFKRHESSESDASNADAPPLSPPGGPPGSGRR